MTGRYPWRFGKGVPGGPWGFLGPRFPVGTHNLGTMLGEVGYRTGYIGKWHLGTAMQTTDGKPQGPDNVDYTKPLNIGPAQFGFDESFILPGSLDMYPYVFARNNRWVGNVNAKKGWSAFNRVGPAAEDFEDTKVLSTFTQEAEQFIHGSAPAAKNGKPFFLFLALTAPHTPTSPSGDFEGKSKVGIYGDFVMEADHCVKRVLASLNEHELDENTLVIATSDHGPAPYAGRKRPATYLQLKELEKEGHFSGGPFRGYKFSVYEGGSRIPFVARWPGVIPKKSTCDRLIALQDLMATLADVSQAELSAEQAPDSISLLPLLQDPQTQPTRSSMVLQGTRAMAVRSGEWKLALCPGSGSEGRWGNTPKHQQAWRDAVEAFGRPPKSRDELLDPAFVQLFNLTDDPGETRNLAAERMDKVKELHAILQETITRGRSTPGKRLANDKESIRPFSSVPASVWKSPADDRSVRCNETAEHIEISIGNKRLLRYQKSVRPSPEGIDPLYQRSGYIHSVSTPSGRVVTGDFAPDHPHQHAIFNAWVRSRFEGREVDFWNQRDNLGRVSHEKVVSIEHVGGNARFVVELLHEEIAADGTARPVLRETWTVTAHKPVGGAFVFDLESAQVCASDSPLVVSEYHYGGMALRGSNQWFSDATAKALQVYRAESKKDPDTPLPEIAQVGHRFLTSEGSDRFEGNHTRPAWVSMFGLVDDRLAGITVMGHPENVAHPRPVRLHPTKPYFCFAPMVLGAFTIEPGAVYRSKFRYVVHDGMPDENLVESVGRDFR